MMMTKMLQGGGEGEGEGGPLGPTPKTTHG